MKLRILGNSVRLRLKQGEVETLATGTSIVEHTHFPGSILTYRLDVSDEADISANLDAGELSVSLPRSAVSAWAATDQVSLVGECGDLAVLVEKDFQCLSPGEHRSHDDDDDTFPHPGAGTDNGC